MKTGMHLHETLVLQDVSRTILLPQRFQIDRLRIVVQRRFAFKILHAVALVRRGCSSLDSIAFRVAAENLDIILVDVLVARCFERIWRI